MKRILFLLACLGLFVFSCSEKNDPVDVDVNAHPEGWVQTHGQLVLNGELSQESCKSCHGEQFGGGTAGVACGECHYYPHTGPWLNPKAEGFHGKVAKQKGLDECTPCHGANFMRDDEVTSCYDCHTFPHLPGWMNLESENFHGDVVQEMGKEECQGCHGTDFQGGSAGVSCYQCHTYPHPEFFKGGTVHGTFIKEELDWNLTACKECHGVEFEGGLVYVGLGCRECHTQPAGPEACNTCHGDFYNPAQIAPPQDLSNNFQTSALGVGAHQAHTMQAKVSNTLNCTTCHPAVDRFSDPSHIDGTPPADIEFSSLAAGAVWNHDQATCSDVYCHGSFSFEKSASGNPWAYADSVITGNPEPVNWTQVDGLGQCGSCHGLPPAGHINNNFTINSCANCHGSVVNASGIIIDKDKHINGQVDLN
ncbi:MAG: CxxxxCH/CxxCH domain-containing protein [Calditrichia bacterium]